MQAPRWFWIASGLLAINFTAVLSTSMHRHIWAGPQHDSEQNQTPDQAASTNGDDRQTPHQSVPVPEQTAEENDPADQPPSLPPASPSPATDSGTEVGAEQLKTVLPSVPSLDATQSLESDPVFQEIQKMLAGDANDRAEAAEPPGIQSTASGRYFDSLQARLKVATQLCQSARSLAAEAAQQASGQNQSASDKLLRMSTQLREMAAELLVLEF